MSNIAVKMIYPESRLVPEKCIRAWVRDTMANLEIEFNAEDASVAECVSFLMENDDCTFTDEYHYT